MIPTPTPAQVTAEPQFPTPMTPPAEVHDVLRRLSEARRTRFWVMLQCGAFEPGDWTDGGWLAKLEAAAPPENPVAEPAQPNETAEDVSAREGWDPFRWDGRNHKSLAAVGWPTIRALGELGIREAQVYLAARALAWRGDAAGKKKKRARVAGELTFSIAEVARRLDETYWSVRMAVDRLVKKGWLQQEKLNSRSSRYVVMMPVTTGGEDS